MDNKHLGLLLVLFGWVVLSTVHPKCLRVSADDVGCKSDETRDKHQDCASFFPLCGDSFLVAYKHLCAKRKRRDNSGIICTFDGLQQGILNVINSDRHQTHTPSVVLGRGRLHPQHPPPPSSRPLPCYVVAAF